jgi:enamine deaminase RidA (YjgF/YER057c/UK114 family)
MRNQACLLLTLICLAGIASAQPPTREHLAPKGWEGSYHDWKYSPVVKVGDMVIVSGIPAAVGENYEAKVRWMFEQLKLHLAVAGATTADVVEVTSFHVTRDTASFRKEFETVSKVSIDYFPDHYPAWTAAATPALLANDAPIELRAVAIIGSGKRPKADIPKPNQADK